MRVITRKQITKIKVTGMMLSLAMALLSGCTSSKNNASLPEENDASEATDVIEQESEETEDAVMTDNIEVFTQSSIRIKGSAGTIYIDPFSMAEGPNDADFIFITHDHYDHYSPEDIAKVISDGKTVVIAPEKLVSTIKNEVNGFSEVISVVPGESYDESGIKFDTVASYNINKSYHPKESGWCGYVLDVDGTKIYVAGDTDATEEAKQVSCDIAMIPIGGTYTMTPKEAAELINEISPKVTIPTHFGAVVGSPEDADEFEKNVDPSITVEKKIAF